MPKLNLSRSTYLDNLSLTRRCIARNEETIKEDGEILVDPSVMAKMSLLECFRILGDPSKISNVLAERQQPPRGITLQDEELTIYGSCTNNGKMNARCGGGIWVS